MRQVLVRVLAVVVIAAGIHGDAAAVQSGSGDLLPDLRVAPLYGIALETTPTGRTRLHFGTIGWNVGDGPIEARGWRIDPQDLVMRVRQRIYQSGGGYRERITPGIMIYETGDRHDHWHLRMFMVVNMYRRGAPNGNVYGLRKLGYCLLDAERMPNPPPNSPPTRVYPAAACGDRGSRSVRTGLSIGYGDDYPPDYAHQWMDITGLSPGVYRICITADPLDEFVEKVETNNQRWTDVSINLATGQLRVVASRIAACGPDVP